MLLHGLCTSHALLGRDRRPLGEVAHPGHRRVSAAPAAGRAENTRVFANSWPTENCKLMAIGLMANCLKTPAVCHESAEGERAFQSVLRLIVDAELEGRQ